MKMWQRFLSLSQKARFPIVLTLKKAVQPMTTFGKKCPRCKTTNFIRQHNNALPYQFPGVQHFTCTDCKQDFAYLLPCSCSILIDKRSSERVAPPNTLLVRIKGAQQQFARIEDISMEGIGFSYNFDLQKFSSDNFTIDLYNCNHGTFLKNLPIQVASSQAGTLTVSVGRQITILRKGARFNLLNRAQKTILKDFIHGFKRRTDNPAGIKERAC